MGPTTKQSSTTQSNLDDVSQIVMNPQLVDALSQGYLGLSKFGTDILGRPVTSNFTAPTEITGASDPRDIAIVQQGIAKAMQNVRGQEAAQNRALSSSLSTAGGNNSALLAALQRQAGMSSAGAMNALAPVAMQQQREADLQRAGLVAQNNAQRMGYEQAKSGAALASRGLEMQGLNTGIGFLDALRGFGVNTGIQLGNRSGTEQTQATSKTRPF